jgi:serine/threonine-protein kinase ATR
MATLQSALAVPALRSVALKAFNRFIVTLKFSEIGPFIGTTSATFVRLWNDLTGEERQTATGTLEYIIMHNADNLTSYVQDVADLSEIPELYLVNKKLMEIRSKWSFTQRSNFLLKRIGSENEVVSLQALKELKGLMTSATSELQAYASGDSFDASVGKLVKVLLSAGAKDGTENHVARNLAFECIGILGALDPDRFETPPEEAPAIVLHNFTDHDESITFALHLIQDLLIAVYRSTNDTKHQEVLAYVIQELLTFCGFTADLIPSGHSSATVTARARERWIRLPKAVHETCGPLLGSSFSVKVRAPVPAVYPIYPSTTSYRDWIRTWTDELISKLKGTEVRRIFSAFPPVIRSGDITVARHLLPHLVLTTVMSGSDEDRTNVKNEMETVLTDQVNLKHNFSENSRLLSAQVSPS